VKLVWEAARAVKIPVIAMGGIMSAKEAIEFLIVGAAAVAVGTVNFVRPAAALEALDGLAAYLIRQGCASVRELTGSLRLQ